MDTFKILTKGIQIKKQQHRHVKNLSNLLIHTQPVIQPSHFNQSQASQTKYQKQAHYKGFLKKLSISFQGQHIPQIINHFQKLVLKYKAPKYILKNLKNMGIEQPTPVQMALSPLIMQNRSVIATSPTGSGKTLAYALPLLCKLKQHSVSGVRAIIFSHSHDLALQLIQQIQKLAKIQKPSKLVIGRMDQFPKVVDILVSTPRKFLKCFKKQKEMFNNLQWVVLDESDKYFQPEYAQQITDIITNLSQFVLKYVLVSATIQHPIQKLLKDNVLQQAVRLKIGHKNTVLKNVIQTLQYCSNQQGKRIFLNNLALQGKLTPPVLIFTQNTQRTKQLAHQLNSILSKLIDTKNNLAHSFHGHKDWKVRQRILKQFNQGKIWCLIATDLISRGIDFKAVNLVINYDFPQSSISYIHRVGRTGRAGREGEAITFFTYQDKDRVRSLANLLKQSGCEVPQWLLKVENKVGKIKRYYIQRQAISRDPKLHQDPNAFQQRRVQDAIFYRKMKKQIRQAQEQSQPQPQPQEQKIHNFG